MIKKKDGTVDYKNDDNEPNLLEQFFAAILAIFFILPLAMLGLLVLKIFNLEDWAAKKIAKYFDTGYHGGCH